MNRAITRVAARWGHELNPRWAEQFVKAGYKYVFVEVPIQPYVLERSFRPRWQGPARQVLSDWRTPHADVVFGDSLDDLHWFDSKKETTTPFSKAQKVSYPRLNENGGVLVWNDKARGRTGQLTPINLVDNQPVDLHGAAIHPERGHIGYKADLHALESGQTELRPMLAARRGQIVPGPRPTTHLDLPGGGTWLTDGGAHVRPSAPSHLPKARVVSGAEHELGALRRLRQGAKLRMLELGAGGWRAVRRVGSFALEMFVLTGPLDALLEISLGLLFQKWEKEEQLERDKRDALQAVLTQSQDGRMEAAAKRGAQSAEAFQRALDTWNTNGRHSGFWYLRIQATVEAVQTVWMVFQGGPREGPTDYKLIQLQTLATSYREMVVEPLTQARERDLTKQETETLRQKNPPLGGPPQRKSVQSRAVYYTAPVPLITPFDLIVAKLTNLFLDLARFVAWFSDREMSAVEGFEGLDYTRAWDEQLVLQLEFPKPLNESVARYCLAYCYVAAKRFSQHTQQTADLRGNLEDPIPGWRRRREILGWALDGEGARNRRRYSDFCAEIRRMAKADSEETGAALQQLFESARSILYDMERIERNFAQPEYYYLGPKYRRP